MPLTAPIAQGSELLSVQGLACRRGDRVLFAGLDLAVHAGELVLVEGPNGVGKSSLLRICAGLLRPFEGTVRCDTDISLCDERLALDADRPLHQALSFWSRPGSGLSVEQALLQFNLDRLGQVPVGYLSTGQRQRARLARNAMRGAVIWLLDEPFNGLDRESRAQCLHAINAHRGNGGAVLITSHIDLPEPPDRTIRLQEYAG